MVFHSCTATVWDAFALILSAIFLVVVGLGTAACAFVLSRLCFRPKACSPFSPMQTRATSTTNEPIMKAPATPRRRRWFDLILLPPISLGVNGTSEEVGRKVAVPPASCRCDATKSRDIEQAGQAQNIYIECNISEERFCDCTRGVLSNRLLSFGTSALPLGLRHGQAEPWSFSKDGNILANGNMQNDPWLTARKKVESCSSCQFMLVWSYYRAARCVPPQPTPRCAVSDHERGSLLFHGALRTIYGNTHGHIFAEESN